MGAPLVPSSGAIDLPDAVCSIKNFACNRGNVGMQKVKTVLEIHPSTARRLQLGLELMRKAISTKP
jgi:hypothetical protein